MIYVYEALCVVISSAILGTSIGLIISVSLTLQFSLFTEMPFEMSLPLELFSSCMVMSVVVTVAGSAHPAREFVKKSVTEVLRRQ